MSTKMILNVLHDESRKSVSAVFAVLRFYIPFRRERCSRHSEEEGSTGSIRETQGGFCTWTFFSHSGWARECLGSCVMVMSVIKRLSNPRIPRTARPRWPEPASRPLVAQQPSARSKWRNSTAGFRCPAHLEGECDPFRPQPAAT